MARSDSGRSVAPLVIGHRGAPGYLPEHTLESFALAISQGAGAVEVDVVPSADGELVVRHDNALGGTTDVAAHPEFAARRTTKWVDGRVMHGWFAEDFRWAELATLTARERLPRLRPQSAAADGRSPILRLADVAALTRGTGTRLVVEIKHAAYFSRRGFPMAELVADALGAMTAPVGSVLIESFEGGVLRELAERGVRAPLIHLVDSWGGPADAPMGPSYRRLLADLGHFEGLAGISTGLRALTDDLVERATARGLQVWTWTLRPENRFLPPRYALPGGLGRHGRYAAYWRRLADTGVSAVFADHPDLAVAAFAEPAL